MLNSSSRAVNVMEQRCWGCHGPALAQSGLRLDSIESALRGGNRGPAIIAGKPAQSRVIQAIRRTGDLVMPPGPKLPDAKISTIEQWIAAGAAWPKTATSANAPAQTWWSFKKVVRPPVPAVKESWVRTPVDAFILQKLADGKTEAGPRGRPARAGEASLPGPARPSTHRRTGGEIRQ